MAGWLSGVLVSWAAWAQDRYFEPEHLDTPWIVYSHDGTIEQLEEEPIHHPGIAIWQQIDDTERYERRDVPVRSHQEPTPLALPIIQAVVRLHSHGRRQRRSRANPRDFDITNQLTMFGGTPSLDWMHVGLCMIHQHGLAVLPGQYTLSLIDGDFNMHELDEGEAAVFSVCAQSETMQEGGGVGLADTATIAARAASAEAAAAAELAAAELAAAEPEPDFDEWEPPGATREEEAENEPEPVPWDYDTDDDVGSGGSGGGGGRASPLPDDAEPGYDSD